MTPCSQCGRPTPYSHHLCAPCHCRALGRAKRRYHWTPDLLDQVRYAYRIPRKREITRRLTALARKTGWPRWQFRIRAADLGLLPFHRRPWTPAELDYLAEHIGSLSIDQLARRLNRTTRSIQLRAQFIDLSTRVRDGYTLADLSAVLGVDHRRAASWVKRGLFGKPLANGQGIRVQDRQVLNFLRRCPSEYDLARVDQEWFKSMVFGSLSGG